MYDVICLFVYKKNVSHFKSTKINKIQKKSDLRTLRLPPAYDQRTNTSSPLVSEHTSFESKSVNDVAPMGLWKNFLRTRNQGPVVQSLIKLILD